MAYLCFFFLSKDRNLKKGTTKGDESYHPSYMMAAKLHKTTHIFHFICCSAVISCRKTKITRTRLMCKVSQNKCLEEIQEVFLFFTKWWMQLDIPAAAISRCAGVTALPAGERWRLQHQIQFVMVCLENKVADQKQLIQAYPEGAHSIILKTQLSD